MHRNEAHKILTTKAKRPRFYVAPKEQRTADGIVFDSRREMNRYLELKILERAGLIEDLQCQPEFKVQINGKHYCTTTFDFLYFDVDKKCDIIEDVKSSGTQKDTSYRLRKKAAELYHNIKIVEIM